MKNIEKTSDLLLFQAIWHFLYYIDLNHMDQHIAWPELMKKHFREKLDGLLRRKNADHIELGCLVSWIQGMSTTYQEPLLDYIKKFHWDKW